jgi:hypothetical protein
MFQIRESQNHLANTGLSLFHPGRCPSYCDHRTSEARTHPRFRPKVRHAVLRHLKTQMNRLFH